MQINSLNTRNLIHCENFNVHGSLIPRVYRVRHLSRYSLERGHCSSIQTLHKQRDPSHHSVVKTRRCFLWRGHYFQLDIFQEPQRLVTQAYHCLRLVGRWSRATVARVCHWYAGNGAEMLSVVPSASNLTAEYDCLSIYPLCGLR